MWGIVVYQNPNLTGVLCLIWQPSWKVSEQRADEGSQRASGMDQCRLALVSDLQLHPSCQPATWQTSGGMLEGALAHPPPWPSLQPEDWGPPAPSLWNTRRDHCCYLTIPTPPGQESCREQVRVAVQLLSRLTLL